MTLQPDYVPDQSMLDARKSASIVASQRQTDGGEPAGVALLHTLRDEWGVGDLTTTVNGDSIVVDACWWGTGADGESEARLCFASECGIQ